MATSPAVLCLRSLLLQTHCLENWGPREVGDTVTSQGLVCFRLQYALRKIRLQNQVNQAVPRHCSA